MQYNSSIFFRIFPFIFLTSISFDIAVVQARRTAITRISSNTKTNFISSPTNDGVVAIAQPAQEYETTKTKNNNVVLQLGGYLKDSLLRFKDGTVELYTNHQKCNTIRTKQKEFQAKYYSSTEALSPLVNSKKRGITYEEYDFLQKQKIDRGKLGNILFLLFAAPNIMPYSIMFFPDSLPSPFHVKKPNTSENDKWMSLSQKQSHAILKTLIDIEKLGNPDSKGASPSLIPFGFGKKKAEKTLEQMKQLLFFTTSFLGINSSNNIGLPLLLQQEQQPGGKIVIPGSDQVEKLLTILRDQMYTTEKPGKDRTRLVIAPKPIIKGLASLLPGPSSSTPAFLENLIPHFMIRSQVLKHVQKLSEGDEFLINEEIPIQTMIHSDLLREVCTERCIGVSSSSTDEELYAKLANWLEFTVVQPRLRQHSSISANPTNSTLPTTSELKKLKFEGVLLTTKKSGDETSATLSEEEEQANVEYYNGNLARVILMCHNAISSTRDYRSCSILPRSLYTTSVQ